ncbi:MAG: murein hydrolase activator EnvC family protein, partial [Fusobacteriaceae bacterium]
EKKIKIFNIIIILMIKSLSIFSANVDTMKKEIKKIETEISTKNKRIKTIGEEKNNLEKDIERTEVEIEEIKQERETILQEIKRVERSIDYVEKNLNITASEKNRIKKANLTKIKIWNRIQLQEEGLGQNPQLKFAFQKMLQGDFQRIERIETIDGEIKKAKSEVEAEKRKLENLRHQALSNSKKLDNKIYQQESLIKKLNSEKNNHESAIKKLIAEKARKEKEIQKIISQRTKVNKNINYSTAQKQVGKLQKPISGKTIIKFNQKKNGVSSNGIEIRGNLGTQVKGAAAGKVIYSDDFQGLGKVIMIDYGYNLIGLYGNLISSQIKVGDRIKKGQNIGILGFSSDSNPDLYYEVRFKLKAVNPENFF